MKLQPIIGKMEAQAKGLREHLETLQSKIEKREDTFNDRAERWQESEAGEAWQEKTVELEDTALEFETAIGEIEVALESIRNLFEMH